MLNRKGRKPKSTLELTQFPLHEKLVQQFEADPGKTAKAKCLFTGKCIVWHCLCSQSFFSFSDYNVWNFSMCLDSLCYHIYST